MWLDGVTSFFLFFSLRENVLFSQGIHCFPSGKTLFSLRENKENNYLVTMSSLNHELFTILDIDAFPRVDDALAREIVDGVVRFRGSDDGLDRCCFRSG